MVSIGNNICWDVKVMNYVHISWIYMNDAIKKGTCRILYVQGIQFCAKDVHL